MSTPAQQRTLRNISNVDMGSNECPSNRIGNLNGDSNVLSPHEQFRAGDLSGSTGGKIRPSTSSTPELTGEANGTTLAPSGARDPPRCAAADHSQLGLRWALILRCGVSRSPEQHRDLIVPDSDIQEVVGNGFQFLFKHR